MKRSAHVALIIAIGAVVVFGGYSLRYRLLVAAGKFLERADAPFAADVIVVIRGDEVYFNRALTAARLFNQGLAPRVYVSSALDDLAAAALQARGVTMPKAQDNVASVLMQSHVACAQILLDHDEPGGGTAGELNRIKAMLTARGYSSAVLVTSWYHTRRLRLLANAAFGNAKISFAVVAAEEPTNAASWWRRRYVAIAVLEEYVKLSMAWLPFQPRFGDDPARARPRIAAPQC